MIDACRANAQAHPELEFGGATHVEFSRLQSFDIGAPRREGGGLIPLGRQQCPALAARKDPRVCTAPLFRQAISRCWQGSIDQAAQYDVRFSGANPKTFCAHFRRTLEGSHSPRTSRMYIGDAATSFGGEEDEMQRTREEAAANAGPGCSQVSARSRANRGKVQPWF